jgi:hypothetical protein
MTVRTVSRESMQHTAMQQQQTVEPAVGSHPNAFMVDRPPPYRHDGSQNKRPAPATATGGNGQKLANSDAGGWMPAPVQSQQQQQQQQLQLQLQLQHQQQQQRLQQQQQHQHQQQHYQQQLQQTTQQLLVQQQQQQHLLMLMQQHQQAHQESGQGAAKRSRAMHQPPADPSRGFVAVPKSGSRGRGARARGGGSGSGGRARGQQLHSIGLSHLGAGGGGTSKVELQSDHDQELKAIRRERRNERNAAMNYDTLFLKLGTMTDQCGGHQFVDQGAISKFFQRGKSPN